jgi:hypothetical protein
MFCRERRNEEQYIQPPVMNNNEKNLIEDPREEKYIDFQEETICFRMLMMLLI